ncbi:MAG: SusD/RagB family nutrient-binding outer membrane lipoprotein [Bacteroidales bacterium]|nr:SusD/RagB family nutrient-binding outer membrane lipoprotein [Bacteroidales bacterium]
MKKINLILLVLIGITLSCTKNFEDFNTDKKRPVEVPGQFLFANAQKAFGDQTASTNVNLNNWKLFAQYFTETTYTDEANYDVVNRNCGSLLFRTYYRDILVDLKDAKRVVTAEVAVGDDAIAVKQNRLLIIDILECFIYQELVDMFGDVPYSEALNIENLYPVYDDAYSIYKDLVTRTTSSVAALNESYGSFGADDLYFGGDISMWKKFGNTLLVKLAINVSNIDPGYAGSIIEAAYAGGFAYGEHCSITYPGESNSNPLFVDMIQSGRHDFVPANTIVDIMNNLEDPRRASYFTLCDTSSNPDVQKLVYKGGIYGESNPFGQNSHMSDAIQESTFPMVIMDYTELAFYLAEAAEKGFSVGGSAATWYENGIRSSFDTWGNTADVDAYLGKPEVAYATAAGTWKQKIGTQAYLAFYIRGFHGWTSWRRLGFPVLNLPPSPAESANGEVPRRHTYPINEQTLNEENYNAAASAVGGDELSTRIFWDNGGDK